MRHTFATDLALFGVNPWTLMNWLGHKELKQTMRYTRFAQAHRRPIPPEVLAAGKGEPDADRRVLAMLGARGKGVAKTETRELKLMSA